MHSVFLTPFLALSAALLGPSVSANENVAESDIVDLGYAKYLGNRTYPTTVAYLGIPYAQAPVGDLRFRAPVPVDTSGNVTEVTDATVYPLDCYQTGVSLTLGSEDCLKVNVYAPAGAKPGDNLPTLVYIHGGGFVYGDPNTWPFDHWIKQSPDIVVVSVYYRLGVYGFLGTPEFSDSDFGDFNTGFLDQIEALKWTSEHIEAFGGSSEKVTIMGQSAGGASVLFHLVAKAEQRFTGAIAQSVYRVSTPYPNQTADVFQTFASNAGCTEGDVQTQLSCLRSVNASVISAAGDVSGGVVGFKPVIDGKYITEPPTHSVLNGRFADVPLIVGATTNETLGAGNDTAKILENYFSSALNYTYADAQELVAAYDGVEFASESLKQQTITGDAELRCARTIMAEHFSNAWTYRFNQADSRLGIPLVTHSADNYFLFNGSDGAINGVTTFHPLTAAEEAFSEEAIAYLISFIRSEDPNTYKLDRSPVWSPYSDDRSRLVQQKNAQNSTTETGTFLEEELDWEVAVCGANAAQVSVQQN